MNRKNLIAVGLVLGLFSLPVSADKPGPPPVDKFESGQSAFDAGRYVKARELWLPLAENGDVRAQYAIGRLHEKGRGLERDFGTAAGRGREEAGGGHGATLS